MNREAGFISLSLFQLFKQITLVFLLVDHLEEPAHTNHAHDHNGNQKMM